jgi:hypothetical protein
MVESDFAPFWVDPILNRDAVSRHGIDYPSASLKAP